MKVKLNKLKCKKCGHEWIPRTTDVRLCPGCQSVFWDVDDKDGEKDDKSTAKD